MTYEIVKEMACAATGTDCPATAAWLQVRLMQDRPCELARANAHWQAADEPLRAAIAAKLGMTEPLSERFPIHDAIVRDYEDLMGRASNLLDFTD